MKIIIAAVTLFALMATEASADNAKRALRELKGMGAKKGSKGGKKGAKGAKSQQQCPTGAENPTLVFPQCEGESKAKSVRFSTFNGSMFRPNEGDLKRELASPGSAQPDTIATIIQKVRPDVLLINEFDYDEDDVSLKRFMSNYLGVAHEGTVPIDYPYYYNAPSNTGIQSGFDLNNDGVIGGPDDGFGYGVFPGQYGFIVLSKYEIVMEDIRTFQEFLWEDMPCAYLPFYPDSGESWYSEEELKAFRLSSKSHWDVPIMIDGEVVHFLAAHPTPAVFDGPEDRNGKRNYDEIRLFADYISDDKRDSDYIYDDGGNYGGIESGKKGKGKSGAKFVIAGDYNADPFESGFNGAATQFTKNPLINNSVVPSSMGGAEQSLRQGDNNLEHCGPAIYDTADFGEAKFGGPGNIRVDYVLPSANMEIVDAGIFWPLEADPDFELVGLFPFPSSDHKMVWVDLVV